MSLFQRDKKPDQSAEPNSSRDLPVIALKNTVIYPHTVVPVFFEDRSSLMALDQAQKEGGVIGVFALKEAARQRIIVEDDKRSEAEADEVENNESEPSSVDAVADAPIDGRVDPKDIYSIGTLCKIHRVMPTPGRPGTMVVLQGTKKIASVHVESTKKGYLQAVVTEVDEQSRDNKEVRALMKNALTTAQKIIQNTPYLPQELQIALEDLNDPIKFVYLLATLVRFDSSEKQEILEEDDVQEKLKKTAAILSRELEQIELGGKIVSNVKKEFNKMSRDAFLRQQLKEIQRELGEENEVQQEANEYRQKLLAGSFPEEVVKEVSREIDRLESMHPQSSEYQVIRTYLDWVFDLPWSLDKVGKKSKSGAVDLVAIKKVLDADHYGLKEVKQRILEYLAVTKLKNDQKGPILCFVGPPGVGKTSLGKSIANALGRSFVRMSLGGMHDEAELRGHRRTYVGAMPGKIIQGVRRAGKMNPVFMLDEIDKVGNDFRGDPSSALLEVLDPEQNNTFRDHYLDLDYDLSQALFIATANVVDTIQPALRDRMEIIELSGYTDEEKVRIAEDHLWPKVLKEHGLTKSQVKADGVVFARVVDQYTREAGVRNLERELAKLVRKSAYLIVEDKTKSITVNDRRVRELLGPQRIFPEVAARTARPGVATGLAYTQAGGEILFIEATMMPGGKKLTLTGSLGDVMKESAQAALSLVRSRSDSLGIGKDVYSKNDLHIHVPSGAVPKDGPSAGVTMVTALTSLMLNRPVRNDVAMTGEITLSGTVLPIGGVKEKVLAARRAGIKTVVLPLKNKSDVEEIDEQLKGELKFKFVSNIDEVLAETLQK